MSRRGRILAGMAAGGVWALVVPAAGAAAWPVSGGALAVAAVALLGPALALAAIVGRVAQARFFDDAIIDGEPPPPGSAVGIDLRALTNTAEQALLAALVWPALAVLLPPDRLGAVAALGLAFPFARAAFWIGYHVSPPARAFGFAATFYPTVVAALLALGLLAFG